MKCIKWIVTSIALFFFFCSFGQTPQIDSLQGDFAPYSTDQKLELSVSIKVFVPNTNSTDSLHIALGSSQGGNEIFETTVATAQLQTGVDDNHATYVIVDA